MFRFDIFMSLLWRLTERTLPAQKTVIKSRDKMLGPAGAKAANGYITETAVDGRIVEHGGQSYMNSILITQVQKRSRNMVIDKLFYWQR